VPLLAGKGFNWFGHEGEGILEPGIEPPIEKLHAVDALLEISRARPGLEIVAVGPLTNLAVALAKEPDFAARIGRLTVMGGHLHEISYRGRVFPFGVDYNLCSDPQASLLVLRAGIPTRLVTADVTLRTRLAEADVARFEAAGTPFLATLARAVRIWTPVQRQLFGAAPSVGEHSAPGATHSAPEDNAAFLHDPLTLACVHDESFCDFEELEIEPAIEHGIFRTLVRAHVTPDSFPMRCATRVDAEKFRGHFAERVARLAQPS
jgi:inosine-uridine nucleoside N-ribohydrolase